MYETLCPAWTAPKLIVLPDTVPVTDPCDTQGDPVIVMVPRRSCPWSCHARVNVPDAVTRTWAELSRHFKDQLGVNDLWIAACALAQPEPLPLVTTDLSDFLPVASKFPLLLIHPDL